MTLNLETIQFAEPLWLWLLLGPGLLLLLWLRRLLARHRDARGLSRARQVPVREHFPALGQALFPLCLILATALVIVALARPGVVASLVRKGGIDIVVLLDGSASMHVKDVPGDRWQRSVRFLRVLGDALRWDDDRIALTLFARIAAPQVRLTRDPNTYFFFLDNLREKSPFPIEDETTWDTNIELGIDWGMRVIDKDTEIRGKSKNAPLFVLISDGQSWSGVVEQSLKRCRDRGIPVMVVGVGTMAGGIIPEPPPDVPPGGRGAPPPNPPVHSTLDRGSLRQIANATGGTYLEMDRDTDINLSNVIIDAARRRVTSLPPEPRMEEFYWQVLTAAGIAALMGLLALRRTELAIGFAGVALTLVTLSGYLL